MAVLLTSSSAVLRDPLPLTISPLQRALTQLGVGQACAPVADGHPIAKGIGGHLQDHRDIHLNRRKAEPSPA